MNLFVIKEVLGSYYEEQNSISSKPYYQRIKSELVIANKHKSKTNSFLFILKIIKIIINKQWLFTFVNIILKLKGHSF